MDWDIDQNEEKRHFRNRSGEFASIREHRISFNVIILSACACFPTDARVFSAETSILSLTFRIHSAIAKSLLFQGHTAHRSFRIEKLR